MGDGDGGASASPSFLWVHRVWVRDKTDTRPCIAVTKNGETRFFRRVKINGPAVIEVHSEPLPEGSHVYLTTYSELETEDADQ